MKKKCFILILCFLILLSVSQPIFASDQDIAYPVRMPYRILRGAANIALGWTEVILRPIGENQTESFTEALATGVANTLIRFTAGATDIATFWVPDIQMLDLYPDWQGWPYWPKSISKEHLVQPDFSRIK